MAADPKGLGAKFDAPTDAEFNTRGIEATMAPMGTLPHVTHVPTMTGGAGYDAVRHFYELLRRARARRLERQVDLAHHRREPAR
jgi:hypothetical protein